MQEKENMYIPVFKGLLKLLNLVEKHSTLSEKLREAQKVILKSGVVQGIPELDESLIKSAMVIWKDKTARSVWNAHRGKIEEKENVLHFMRNPESLEDDYQMTVMDWILTRDYSKHIMTRDVYYRRYPNTRPIHFALTEFHLKGVSDGGKKILNSHLDKAFLCLYVIDISEFNVIVEDEPTPTTKLHKALAHFEEVVNNNKYKTIGFIVLLNKADLFHRKLCTSPMLQEYWPEFSGARKKSEVSKYVKEMEDQQKLDEYYFAAASFVESKLLAMPGELHFKIFLLKPVLLIQYLMQS